MFAKEFPVPRQDLVLGLILGGRGWSVFAKPRGFLRKASVQPRPPNTESED